MPPLQFPTQLTPLHVAVFYKSSGPVLRVLIEAGAEIEARDSNEKSPLHWAAIYNTEAIPVLLEAGADTEARTNSQDTPLHLTIAYYNTKGVKPLIDANANVNALNGFNYSPLFLALVRDQRDSVVALCNAGADSDLGDPDLDQVHFHGSLFLVK